jgi:uncharacterized membrane protein YkoI
MPSTQTIQKVAATGAVLAAAALGGSALADAASSTGSNGAAAQAPAQRPDPTTPGGHVGANGKTEQALPDAVAGKVEAAAKAKVPGATIERVETDVDHGSPYEAHMKKSDGTELEVLVNSNFEVTAVNTMGPH